MATEGISDNITQNTGIDALLPLLDVLGLRCVWSRYFDMAEYRMQTFRFTDDTIKYFEEGRGWIRKDREAPVPFEAPCLVLCRKSGIYHARSEGRIRAYVMHFECLLSRDPELSLLDALDLPLPVPASLVPDAGPILKTTTEEFSRRRLGTQLLLDGYLRILLVGLLRTWSPAGPGPLAPKGFMRLAPALARMTERLDRPIAVPEMAAAVGLSAGHFTERFRRIFHVTPRQYANRIRLERARQLLLTTELTIDQISRSLGFSYTHYFDRIFKSSTGDTPQAYRRKHLL